LIGTTIVPYNLFLHASLVSEKWKGASFLKAARWDTVIAISLGGIVSMAIVIAASAVESSGVETVMDLAESLRPVFGDFATYLLAIGLVAAGVTSAITAPLAAAYVVNGCLGWNAGLQSRKFRWVWLVIVLLGVVFSTIGFEPILIIRFAQIANGILLPVIVAVLLWMVNQRQLLGEHRNSRWQNFMGGLILLTSVFLGVKSIVSVLGLW
jgi:Mn2+/Fe2+ NRAMP family transporter